MSIRNIYGRRAVVRRKAGWLRGRATARACFASTSFFILIDTAKKGFIDGGLSSDPLMPYRLGVSRREFLMNTSCGFGYLAFLGIAAEAAERENIGKGVGASRQSGPISSQSQTRNFPLHALRDPIDTFDPKPN
jgi:hypothetical protein